MMKGWKTWAAAAGLCGLGVFLMLHGKRFGSGEYGRVVRVGQDEPITNNAGPIEVSASPNTVFIDAPAGLGTEEV